MPFEARELEQRDYKGLEDKDETEHPEEALGAIGSPLLGDSVADILGFEMIHLEAESESDGDDGWLYVEDQYAS